MKSGMLIVAVLASVIAGAGGGYVAATYGAPEKASNKVAVDSKPLEVNADDAGSAKDHTDEIAQLRGELQTMDLLLQKTVSKKEYDALAAKYDELNERLEGLKNTSVVANNGGEGGGVAGQPAPGTPEFDEAVAKAMEAKEAADRAEWQQRQEDRMKERLVEEKERVLTTMKDKLGLTPAQEASVGTILESYNTKRTELMDRGRAAMQSGEQFDWRAERQKIETETQEAIKAELTLSQVSSFTELLGDNEIDDIGEERGQGRNRGFGGGGFGGGGRRGN